MMKFDKFFTLAKEAGIEALEIYVRKSSNLSFSLFQTHLDSYSISDKQTLAARGIFKGQMAYAYSEKIDKTTPNFIIDQLLENAKNLDKDTKPVIFKGSERYKKFNAFNPNLKTYPVEKKIDLLHQIEAKLKNSDERISEIGGLQYEESTEEVMLFNSYGLSLKQKSNYFVIYAEAVVKDGEDIKTGYKIYLDNDIAKFDVDSFVDNVKNEAISKLGGKPCASKKYKTLLGAKVVSSLLSALLTSTIAEEVQKHSSLFEGKIGEQVASKKVTIIEDPSKKNVFNRYFDDEGVATYKKTIIDKGVLKAYLYNLETAQKEETNTTGNGYRYSAKSSIGTNYVNITLKPGKKSEKEIIEGIKEGIYIKDVQGLHAGLNSQSGNFSLQASGFMIRDGKIQEPVNLITVAGNLLQLFKDVIAVSSDSELQLSSMTTSSVLVKKLSISGK